MTAFHILAMPVEETSMGRGGAILRFFYEGQYKGALTINYDPLENKDRTLAAIEAKMAELGINHAAINTTGDPEYFSGGLWAFIGALGVRDRPEKTAS